jgi:hypothetical protein
MRRAREADVHELATGMPHVTVWRGPRDNPVYQVGGKSFVFFRNPRPDAVDSRTGERYPDVIMFWVASEADKQALVQDEASPFFTTAHFDGHPSVLVRACRLGELTLAELAEVVQDAWLARASSRRAATWLAAQGGAGDLGVKVPLGTLERAQSAIDHILGLQRSDGSSRDVKNT